MIYQTTPDDTHANILQDFLGKLNQPKKTLDLCNISTMEIDEEQGELTVYWRTELDPVETKIIVERIEAKDQNGFVEEITLSERDTESVIQELFLELARM